MGNTASNNYYAGIRLFASDNSNITGNTANSNKYDGIHLARSHNNTISGNNANDNECGIFFYNSSYNTISGNTLIGNDECIFELGLCQGNVIQDNDCARTRITPSLNYLPIILIISTVIIGVSVFIIFKNRKRFKRPQQDLEFL